MKDVVFENNGEILDLLLAYPIGLFALLDEESFFPKATGKGGQTKARTI